MSATRHHLICSHGEGSPPISVCTHAHALGSASTKTAFIKNLLQSTNCMKGSTHTHTYTRRNFLLIIEDVQQLESGTVVTPGKLWSSPLLHSLLMLHGNTIFLMKKKSIFGTQACKYVQLTGGSVTKSGLQDIAVVLLKTLDCHKNHCRF